MATPKIVPQSAPQDFRVHVGLDEKGNIKVDPDPFWIYRCEHEQVRWVCVQHHAHGDADHPCFTVDFDPKDNPGKPPLFNNTHFEGHGALSDQPTEKATHKDLYKYTVRMPGKEPLDPNGGVEP